MGGTPGQRESGSGSGRCASARWISASWLLGRHSLRAGGPGGDTVRPPDRPTARPHDRPTARPPDSPTEPAAPPAGGAARAERTGPLADTPDDPTTSPANPSLPEERRRAVTLGEPARLT